MICMRWSWRSSSTNWENLGMTWMRGWLRIWLIDFHLCLHQMIYWISSLTCEVSLKVRFSSLHHVWILLFIVLFFLYEGILGSLDSGAVQDDRIVLDHNSNLGMFVRRCILAFNLLSFEVLLLFTFLSFLFCFKLNNSTLLFNLILYSTRLLSFYVYCLQAAIKQKWVFERNSPIHCYVKPVQGVCHLFSSIEAYCREAHSSSAQYDASNSNLESLTQYDQMDMEIYVMDKATKEMELHRNASGSVSFHLHTPEALFKVTEGIPYYSPIYAQEEFLRISGVRKLRKLNLHATVLIYV